MGARVPVAMDLRLRGLHRGPDALEPLPVVHRLRPARRPGDLPGPRKLRPHDRRPPRPIGHVEHGVLHPSVRSAVDDPRHLPRVSAQPHRGPLLRLLSNLVLPPECHTGGGGRHPVPHAPDLERAPQSGPRPAGDRRPELVQRPGLDQERHHHHDAVEHRRHGGDPLRRPPQCPHRALRGRAHRRRRPMAPVPQRHACR